MEIKQVVVPTQECSSGATRSIREWFDAVVDSCRNDVHEVDSLTEEDIWQRHGPMLWRAKRFVGSPTFYPVYRFEDYYSYSPLSLIIAKGQIDVNQQVAQQAAAPGFLYTQSSATIDTQIHRIGGPAKSSRQILTPERFIEELAQSLVADAAKIEGLNPGTTNIILCGGKDSLNLLLLPWRQNIVVASAPPNYEVVVEFVEKNGLNLEVIPLKDRIDPVVLQSECIANACRIGLHHARWGADLVELADRYDRKVVFWKGQLADAYTTPKWMTITHPTDSSTLLLRKAYERGAKLVPGFLRHPLETVLMAGHFRQAMWQRCAMMQGAHVALIRDITGCLTLSAYHGGATTQVLSSIDISRVATRDIRPEVGELILGRPVIYPTKNIGPPVSTARAGLCHPDRFLEELAGCGFTSEKG